MKRNKLTNFSIMNYITRLVLHNAYYNQLVYKKELPEKVIKEELDSNFVNNFIIIK